MSQQGKAPQPPAPAASLARDKAPQESPQDPKELVGHVSHDELCDTMHEQLQHLEGDIEEDLFSISVTGLQISGQHQLKK